MNHSSIIQQPVAPVFVNRNQHQGIKLTVVRAILLNRRLTENVLKLGVYISRFLTRAP
jgi:hypothetical protein